MRQTLAITGANGFLGRHLISRCISNNNFKLRILIRNRNSLKHLSGDKITLCEGDLLKPESLAGFLRPDSTLVHLAYMEDNHNSNLEATANLIKAVKQAGVKRVIHCSTAVIVGFRTKGVITEETKLLPEGIYQQVKYKIEKMLLNELPPEIELAILRPTEIIGPGGHGLHSMIERLYCKNYYKNFLYHCILKNRRFNYVSVYNVVASLILLASVSAAQNGDIYIISDDDDTNNNYDNVEKIINLNLNKKCEYPFNIGIPRSLLSFIFKLLPGASSPNRVYSHKKISELGYIRTISLHSAISEIVSFSDNKIIKTKKK